MPFTKENAREAGRKGGLQNGRDADERDATGLAPSQVLKDMRWVYARKKAKNERHEGLEEMYRADRKGFIAQLIRLEEAQARRAEKKAAQAPPAEKEKVEADEGTKAALELLARWSRKNAGAGAAAGPG